MRRIALAGVLAVACVPNATVVPTATPSTPASPLTAPLTAQAWIDEVRYELRGEERFVLDGDVPLTLGIDFSAEMDKTAVETLLRRTLPEGASYEWQRDLAGPPGSLDRSRLLVGVPPGDSFTLDLTGAPSAAGTRWLGRFVRSVQRPTFEISFHRPADLAAGRVAPTRATRLRRSLSLPGHIPIAPDVETVLIRHSPAAGRGQISVVHLPSGRYTAHPREREISGGVSLLDWLPDGRLIIALHDKVVVGDAYGVNTWTLPGVVGQIATVSPSGGQVALWSYAEKTVHILDLATESLRPVPGAFGRCTVGGHVFVAWASDLRLSISSCDEEFSAPITTRVFDARSGQLLSTNQGVSIRAYLADGARLIEKFQPVADMSPDPRASVVVNSAGAEHTTFQSHPYLIFISPDRRYIGYTQLEAESRATVIEVATGKSYVVRSNAHAAGWTKQGDLMVVTKVRD